jgi:ABC-type phosphate transport system auxiliary subunit
MAVGRGFQGPKFEFQSQFVELPLDFMQKQLDARGKEQEKQNALVVDMLGKKIPVHNEDIYGIEHAKQLKNNLDSQLNELSGTDFTAPGSTQKIMGVKSQFNKIFSQFGDADQLIERGNTIDAAKKSIADAKASDITKQYKLNELRQRIKNSPMGTKIKAPSIVNEVDVPKLMLDVAKEVVSDSKELESLRVTDPKDALTMMSSTGKEVTVSRTKLLNTLHNYFKYDPAVASTVQQQAEVFSNGDPDKYKTLSNLNVIGEKGTVDNNSLYGAAMESALSAKTKRDIGIKYDYTENRQGKLEAEDAAKNANIAISTDALVQGFGSQFKTPTDIKTAIETHNLANEGVLEKAKNVSINGEKVLTSQQLRLLDYAKQGGNDWAKNIDGYSATPTQKQLILGYLAEIEQNQDRANKINEIDKIARTEAGLDNYKVPQP